MTKLEAGDLNEFVRINTKFSDLMKNDVFKKKILKAMKSITNMGAVDFLLVDDEPIFLGIIKYCWIGFIISLSWKKLFPMYFNLNIP